MCTGVTDGYPELQSVYIDDKQVRPECWEEGELSWKKRERFVPREYYPTDDTVPLRVDTVSGQWYYRMDSGTLHGPYPSGQMSYVKWNQYAYSHIEITVENDRGQRRSYKFNVGPPSMLDFVAVVMPLLCVEWP